MNVINRSKILTKHTGRKLRRKLKALLYTKEQCRKEFLRMLSSDDPLEDSIFAGNPETYVPASKKPVT